MNRHIFAGSICVIVAITTGCAMNKQAAPSEPAFRLSPEMMATSSSTNPPADIRDYSRFSPTHHNKSLHDYAQQMVMQLNAQDRFEGPVAVTSFVEFDDRLSRTNSLGNQLAEAVLIEMGSLGYPVSDINAAGAIAVNSDGSFAFTRKQSKEMAEVCCVLSGNLIYEANGVRVNSKLFNLQNKRILAASSVTIPYFVIEHLGGAQTR